MRELLLLEVNPTESCKVWGAYYKKLRDSGVESLDLVVADGLKGLNDRATYCFSEARFQRRVAHKMGNLLHKVRPDDKAALAPALTKIFNNFEPTSTLEAAGVRLTAFCERWEVFTSRILT